MSKSRDRVLQALNHQNTDYVPVDFGSTAVTGIHCRIVEALRNHYGLESKPVKIVDAFQMLGEVDEELAELLGVDCIGIGGAKDIFDLDTTQLHEQVTPWGQRVLVPLSMDLTPDNQGDVYVYAGGDKTYPPSAVMPKGCYFINAIERQQPIDEDKLNPEDNVEEFTLLTDADLAYYKELVDKVSGSGKAVVASFGGTALGDVAFVPGMGLKEPKGIRSVVEWYMSTAMRQDYLHQVFEKEIDIAIANYEKLWNTLGDKVDVVLTCGTDFGSQESQFCSLDTFNELWLPHYRRMNDWIHQHTTWKVFKHSCGAIIPILPGLIEAGFDIINPVQINAKDMDSHRLKKEFGSQLTFWGGGIDTQQILPFGTPDEIRRHVIEQCEILGRDGGFIFNAVHNIQANVPVENVVSLFDTLRSLRN
jgi:uroporphyrinogen-III decarboxylase